MVIPSNMASSSGQADNKKQSDEGYLLYGGLFASQTCLEDIERQTLPPDLVQHSNMQDNCLQYQMSYKDVSLTLTFCKSSCPG